MISMNESNETSQKESGSIIHPRWLTKMDTAFQQIELALQSQKKAFQQTEKEMGALKKGYKTLVENIKKQTEKKPKKLSGFALPVPISDSLCKFLNVPPGSQFSRTEFTQYLNHYITENNLIDPEKKSLIVPNDTLLELLGPTAELDTLTRFTIQRYMNVHFYKQE